MRKEIAMQLKQQTRENLKKIFANEGKIGGKAEIQKIVDIINEDGVYPEMIRTYSDSNCKNIEANLKTGLLIYNSRGIFETAYNQAKETCRKEPNIDFCLCFNWHYYVLVIRELMRFEQRMNAYYGMSKYHSINAVYHRLVSARENLYRMLINEEYGPELAYNRSVNLKTYELLAELDMGSVYTKLANEGYKTNASQGYRLSWNKVKDPMNDTLKHLCIFMNVPLDESIPFEERFVEGLPITREEYQNKSDHNTPGNGQKGALKKTLKNR